MTLGGIAERNGSGIVTIEAGRPAAAMAFLTCGQRMTGSARRGTILFALIQLDASWCSMSSILV
jgi:hypothetical protein